MKHSSLLCTFILFGFLLGVHQGRIALWQDTGSEPIKVFPYYARMLPAADRRALEDGIRFESSEDLIRLLTDYLS